MIKPYGITIFCDDIRDEVSGKKSLIGTYFGEMVVNGQFPALVPMFAMSIIYLEPIDSPVTPVSIKVLVPGDEGEQEVLLDVDLPEDRPQRPPGDTDPLAQFRSHMLAFKVSPLFIKASGHIKVRAYLGDEEIRLGSLRIRSEPLAES